MLDESYIHPWFVLGLVLRRISGTEFDMHASRPGITLTYCVTTRACPKPLVDNSAGISIISLETLLLVRWQFSTNYNREHNPTKSLVASRTIACPTRTGQDGFSPTNPFRLCFDANEKQIHVVLQKLLEEYELRNKVERRNGHKRNSRLASPHTPRIVRDSRVMYGG